MQNNKLNAPIKYKQLKEWSCKLVAKNNAIPVNVAGRLFFKVKVKFKILSESV